MALVGRRLRAQALQQKKNGRRMRPFLLPIEKI
jgi:hypothetical protein